MSAIAGQDKSKRKRSGTGNGMLPRTGNFGTILGSQMAGQSKNPIERNNGLGAALKVKTSFNGPSERKSLV